LLWKLPYCGRLSLAVVCISGDRLTLVVRARL
jgi:hypothetical protein